MARTDASPAVSVERFFQSSLLGLVASGYLAVAGSGYLDLPTILVTAAALLLRGLLIYGFVQLEISERASTLATIAYTGFYVLDYFVISRDFLAATVHLVFFLAVIKILTARTQRDHLYTAVIAFLELVAAAILSVNFNFFLFLTLYLLFAIAALTSGEIRRSVYKAPATARSGLRKFHPRLAALSLAVSLGILALTAGMFFLLPRTADAAFSRLIPHRLHLPGFSNQVTLGEIGEIKNTSRPVMHIRVYKDLKNGLKWRGSTLTDFDGKRWFNPTRTKERVRVVNGEADLVPFAEVPLGRNRVNYEVNFDELDTDALFFAGDPVTVHLRAEGFYRTEGGGYRLGGPPQPGFRYDAYSVLEEIPERSAALIPPPVLPLAVRERYLQLPIIDGRIHQLARTMASGFTSDLARARAVERRLRGDYGYTLQLPSHEVADPLAYFLFTRKKGHCEYFASSMTVMLRSLGIPARLATGFLSGIYNPLTDLWVVRSSDAHAWVEAWIPGYGWTTFDPTPADPYPQSLSIVTRLNLYLDAAETFWQQWVVGYDAGQQGSLVDRFEQGARRAGVHWFDLSGWFGSDWDVRAGRWLRQWGLRVLLVLALGVWAWFLGPPLVRLVRMRQRVQRVRRGEASMADATLLYQRMLHVLRRHGYHKPPWFTPAEFAASISYSPVAATVQEFTASYNALRFGGRVDAAPRLSILLDELEKQERRL
jgi:transglutaminase-like putative cysteine protease